MTLFQAQVLVLQVSTHILDKQALLQSQLILTMLTLTILLLRMMLKIIKLEIQVQLLVYLLEKVHLMVDQRYSKMIEL